MCTKEFEDAVVNITTKGLNKMVSQFPGYVAEQIEKVVKVERERVIDECIKAANGTICRCMCPENQGRYEVITKLKQLKEE